MAEQAIEAGAVFKVPYPFMRIEYDLTEWNGEDALASSIVKSWKPGCEYVPRGPYGEDSEGVCDGEGWMVLTVVEVFKPGKYPARVFFTRQWVDPEGRTFGKNNLRIMTLPAFKRRAAGWFAEPYTVQQEEVTS
ncbi:hypothetical protein ABIC89_001012 [Variovorax boronicumulans]|jgi:hypothetical protein|uniref:hypothetical protein n=1 Tax=Variovorax boronicumulans TaxID=436515 RepID=UPI003396C0B1